MKLWVLIFPAGDWDAEQDFSRETLVESFLDHKLRDRHPEVLLKDGDEVSIETPDIIEAAADILCSDAEWTDPLDAPEWVQETSAYDNWLGHHAEEAVYGTANEQAARDYRASVI